MVSPACGGRHLAVMCARERVGRIPAWPGLQNDRCGNRNAVAALSKGARRLDSAGTGVLAPVFLDQIPEDNAEPHQETKPYESHPDQGFHATLPLRLLVAQVFPLQIALQLGRIRRQTLTAARGVKHMGHTLVTLGLRFRPGGVPPGRDDGCAPGFRQRKRCYPAGAKTPAERPKPGG